MGHSSYRCVRNPAKPDDAEPILGVTALESARIEVGPRTQRLKRLPAVRLKAARRADRSR